MCCQNEYDSCVVLWRRGAWGGRLGGPPALPSATAAAASGPGVGGDGEDWGGDTLGYYTKSRETIQSPDRLHKAPTDNTRPRKIIQSTNRLYKHIEY